MLSVNMIIVPREIFSRFKIIQFFSKCSFGLHVLVNRCQKCCVDTQGLEESSAHVLSFKIIAKLYLKLNPKLKTKLALKSHPICS